MSGSGAVDASVRSPFHSPESVRALVSLLLLVRLIGSKEVSAPWFSAAIVPADNRLEVSSSVVPISGACGRDVDALSGACGPSMPVVSVAAERGVMASWSCPTLRPALWESAVGRTVSSIMMSVVVAERVLVVAVCCCQKQLLRSEYRGKDWSWYWFGIVLCLCCHVLFLLFFYWLCFPVGGLVSWWVGGLVGETVLSDRI